jgi:hypothetical protein
MKRILLAIVAALALAVGSGTALAQRGGGGHDGGARQGGGWQGGGGHGGWQGGGGHGGWRGGGGHGGWQGGHGGWRGGTRIGIGFGFPGFYWGGWGYPYYAGYPYYSSYPYYAAYPYSYSDEPVYGEPGPSTYIQRDSAPQGSQGSAGQYSYYCPDPAGYYPQLQNCPKGWLKVVPENSPLPPR